MRTPATPLPLALLLAACGSASPTSAPMRVPLGDSPQRGPSDAWVTIVEFSDFQCPFCGMAEPTIEQVLALHPADVRLVYKHFPLPQHPGARPAANAAECARVQGTGYFWEMHDLLFANQRSLDDASLAGYASRIAGLDGVTWRACFAARQLDARVQADLDLGVAVGVSATPTFAVNGEPLVGAAPLDTFQGVVEAARAEAIASGIPRAQYYDRAVLGK